MKFGWIVAAAALAGVAGCDAEIAMDAGSVPLRTGTGTAEAACLARVNENFGRDVAVVVSSEFSEANTEVMLEAEGETFRCLSSNSGEVAELAAVG